MSFSMCPRAKRTVRGEGEFQFAGLKVFTVGGGDRFLRALRIFLPELKLERVAREEANVVLSVALVLLVGIEGVLIATLVACTVRTVEYAVFCFRKLLKVSVLHLVKHYLLMALAFVSSLFLGRLVVAPEIGNYGHWALYAILSTVLAAAVVLAFSLLFYRDQCREMLRKVLKKSKR